MKQSHSTPISAFLLAIALLFVGPVLAQDAMFIDANGRVGIGASAVPDGMYSLVFSIWDDTSGGNLLWSETHLVQTKDGLWNATLGSLTQLPVDVMAPDTSSTAGDRFLQMEFDGEAIEPRRRMGGLPFAGVSQRLRGDIITSPGKLELRSPDEMNPGMSVQLEVTEDTFGDPEARLSFFATDPSRASSKPKEIVVVGSKVKEVVRFYENATEDEVATREHVSGRATGRRTYPPFRVTGAVLPDSVPAYDLSVDSSGSYLSMSKNNTDGSSCWVRVSQSHQGSNWETSAADGTTSTTEYHKSSPKLMQSCATGTHTSGDSVSVLEFVNPDSGSGIDVVQISGTSAKKAVRATALKALKDLVQGNVYVDSLHITDGNSSTETVDAADYALWRRNYGSAGATASTQASEQISVDSGYKFELNLTDGSTSASNVDAHDYALWRRNSGYTATSGQYTSFSSTMGLDTGYSEITTAGDAAGNKAEDVKIVQQTSNEASAISSLRTLVSSQAMFHETKLDSGEFSWSIGKTSPAVVIIGALTTIGSSLDSKMDRETSELKTNASTALDSTGSRWSLETEEVLPTKAGKRLTKAQIITELAGSSSSNEFEDDDNNTIVQSEATPTSSKLFVGGLSWDAVAGEDGVEVHATNGRKTVRAHDFMAASTDTGSNFELTAAEDTAKMQLRSGDFGSDGFSDIIVGSGSAGLRLKGGNSGVYHSSLSSNTAGSSLRFSQILPSRAIADMIALEHSTTSSKLYVGNLGFGSNDGVNIISDFSGGARIGVGTNAPGVALHVVGSICYTGGITSCSDGRYKEDVKTIDDALDIIEHLRGVEYKWKKDEYPEMRFSDAQQVGLIAQEVKEVLPELVSEDAGGYYSVDYVKLTPILIEAIKQQQKTIDELKKKMSDNSELNERLSQLEKLVQRFVADND